MEFQKVIRVRRSTRGYKPEPVPDDVLGPILEAARLAPTAANKQPFQLVVVTDPLTRSRFREVYDREWFWTAPMIIVGCVDPAQAWQRADGFNAAEVDLAIVMDHLVLAATEAGLGTCWVCNFDEARVKEILGIPANINVVAMTPMGYAAAEPRPFQRKPLADLVRRERW